MAQLVKDPPAVREMWVQSLGWEDPLEKGKATHSSILYSPWGRKESDFLHFPNNWFATLKHLLQRALKRRHWITQKIVLLYTSLNFWSHVHTQAMRPVEPVAWTGREGT